ncbi:hypothetical protein FB451DRAFT_1237707 [Mycena latifolia]|nr:hypothetical protein FB451DRAFT_1237707 [Mycena latifolia]
MEPTRHPSVLQKISVLPPLQSSEPSSSENIFEGEAPVPPRREYVWRTIDRGQQSLATIGNRIARELDLKLSSVNKFAWTDDRSPHRCAGYVREEITLATTVADSAVVSFDSPSPLEICPVCREIVGVQEEFRCICGDTNPGSRPTAKCQECKIWSHIDCVGNSKEFICQFCSIGQASSSQTVRTRTTSENHIPRPPNAFILFRSAFFESQHVSAKVEMDHSTLSRIMGMTWMNLTHNERQVWHHKAKDAAAEHKRTFPTYVFRPKYTHDRKDPNGAQPKSEWNVPEVSVDHRRCEKIAELLLEGKKGAELDSAIKEFDQHHVSTYVPPIALTAGTSWGSLTASASPQDVPAAPPAISYMKQAPGSVLDAPPPISVHQNTAVDVGPIRWGKDISGQVRGLIARMARGSTIDADAVKGLHAKRFPKNNWFVAVFFPTNIAAIQFVNAWAAAPAPGFEKVSVSFGSL